MIWMVLAFPLLGALLNGFLLPRRSKLLSHGVAVAAVGGAFVCACSVFLDFFVSRRPQLHFGFDWLRAGKFVAPFELVVDQLSGLMILIITGIGTLIHIYAGGYMKEEETTYRFFAYLNLFIFMMLLLVLGNNLLVMFVGWEGVGLCSYLLIGYWFQEEANAKAGMKAFLVNRIGDIGFLIGIFLTFRHFGTVSFTELSSWMNLMPTLPDPYPKAIFWITLSFFIGACGKSAQLPLYVWLPDAMAGPTPVSALIHAATMVTAGIFMMTRMSFFYYAAPDTMLIVACVGALTALFAATIALVQTDIKKVLAYSTVSQLGYMVLACGVGAFDAGVFHLLTHACFKALLFLGAGSVIFAMHHEQDMRRMGGLRKYLPITHAVMLIGVLAIIGVPGFSGFFSKDEILWKAFIFPTYGPILWGVGFLAAGCTAFYMVRLLCLTFYGPSYHDPHAHHHHHEPHETPWYMWAPLVVLAFLSIAVGYLGVPDFLAHLVGGRNLFASYLEGLVYIPTSAQSAWTHLHAEHAHRLEWGLMLTSVAWVALAAGTAVFCYVNRPVRGVAGFLGAHFPRVHQLLLDKYRVDECYQQKIVTPLAEISTFLWQIFDIRILNGCVNWVGYLLMGTSGIASFRMTGSLHRYGFWVLAGTVGVLVFSCF